MGIYLILLLIILGLAVGLIVWIYHLFRLYKKGHKRSFAIQVTILVLLISYITWELQIFPLSKNVFIKEQCSVLTGKSFWSWKEFAHHEWGVRGEGYTLDIYKFNDEIAQYFKNPDQTFFKYYPPTTYSSIRWTPTPVKSQDLDVLEFVTPIYAGWDGEVVSRQKFIKDIATAPGSYYSYKDGGSSDFYIISPKDRLIILINHNM